MRTGTNKLMEALEKLCSDSFFLPQKDRDYLTSQSIAFIAHELTKINYLELLEAKAKKKPIPEKRLKELEELTNKAVGCRDFYDRHIRYLKLIFEK